MNVKIPATLLALFVILANQLSAQSPIISYNDFLQQAIDFKNRQNVEEVWVIHFWASWNGPSMEDVSPLKRMSSQYSNKPVRFVGISVDKLQSNWERALRQLQMPWEQLIIPREDDYTFLKKAFRHNSLPALFVVDQQGLVRRLETAQELSSYLASATVALPNRPYNANFSSTVSSQPSSQPSTPPPSTVSSQAPPPVSTSGSGEWQMHTVQKGETLYRIFKTYGVPVDEIKANNGMTSNNISVGQNLKIRRR